MSSIVLSAMEAAASYTHLGSRIGLASLVLDETIALGGSAE
jgi:hypothetical protein